MNRLREVGQALTRKLGPLPVWTWAAIVGAGIYVYRTRKGIGAASSQTDTSANAPTISDQTASRGDPTSLQPGESLYDPNTGELTTAPGQANSGAGADSPVPLDPIPLAPGEHQLLGNHNHAKKKKTGKRKPKAKAHHKPTKGHAHPGKGNKMRPRGAAKLHNPLHKKSKQPTSKTGKQRGKPKAQSKAPARSRASVAKTPAMRQRPAAPRIINHSTQKVVPHPAAAPKPAPRPAARKRH